MKWLNATCIALLMVGQSRALTNAELLNGVQWRSIGPAVMGGRITDIAGVPGDLGRVYVASASGGLFRTDNGGTTWRPLFDRQSTISIGALAVEPGNPNTVWVGTGESNLRNSVSFGDGVYKSLDGGATWTSMGLRDTQTIEPWSRVARYTWMLDWTMPKAFGGRFLSKTDRDRLKGFEGDVSVTNADAAWIEAVVIQAHQAVEAWRNRGNAAA